MRLLHRAGVMDSYSASMSVHSLGTFSRHGIQQTKKVADLPPIAACRQDASCQIDGMHDRDSPETDMNPLRPLLKINNQSSRGMGPPS
jgi:hypothetical protein